MTRAFGRAVAMALLLLAGLAILAAVFPWASDRKRNHLKRSWSRWVIAAAGLRLVSRPGTMHAPSRPTMIVMNHVSWLDIIVLNAVMPVTFVAKSEIRGWPLVGLLAARTGTIFIERGSRHAVRRVNHEIVHRIDRGEVVAFFPEGTTSDGRQVLPFHASLFAMAVPNSEHQRSGAVVVPMAILYRHRGHPTTQAAYIDDQTLVGSMVNILSLSGLEVILEALEPVTADATPDARHALAMQTREHIAQAVSRHWGQA
ncbi:MAG: hypothetical protein RLZZ281_286 [Pseudomonadota bacterium]